MCARVANGESVRACVRACKCVRAGVQVRVRVRACAREREGWWGWGWGWGWVDRVHRNVTAGRCGGERALRTQTRPRALARSMRERSALEYPESGPSRPSCAPARHRH